MSETAILDLVGLIYDAAADARCWPAFLTALARATGDPIANIDYHDIRTASGSLAAQVGLDPSWQKSYDEYYRTLNPWLNQPRVPTSAGAVATTGMIFPEEELTRCEYFHDFLAPQGIFRGLGAIIDHSASAVTAIMIVRPKRRGDFAAREVALLRSLVPHLQRAFQFHRRFALLEGQRRSLNLSSPSNATIAASQGVGTILDDDPAPPLITASIGDAAPLTEGNSGTTSDVFTVTLSAASTQTVSVAYATASDTATASSDYTSKSGTLNFMPGQTIKTISVPVKGELAQELDESFFVNLSSPAGVTIADGRGIGTILNDDGPPSISIADKSVTEGDTGTKNMTFTATLSGATYNPVTVDYATADAGTGAGFAAAGTDYVTKTGTLTFTPGQTSRTFSVSIKGDLLSEGAEGFNVDLSNETNASLADGQAVATIVDNEP